MKPKYHLIAITLMTLALLALGAGGAAPQDVELGRALEFPRDSVSLPEAPPPRGPSTGLTVDTSNRSAVVNFWNDTYQDSEGVAAGWTGDMGTCVAGTTSTVYHEATLRRVNYFRAMSGLPGDITFNATFDAKCQEAALMMIAEGALSHSPPPTWSCYTVDGAEAAGASNLSLGRHGPAAISGFIEDDGAFNTEVGHRRWILYPPQSTMGSGSTTAENLPFIGSNALWIADQASWGPRPPGTTIVVWPPEGFVPYQVVYDRWSLSHETGDFSIASVTMTQGGNPIPVNSIYGSTSPGVIPDPTIVWEPIGLPSGAPAQDTTYTVLVANVLFGTFTQDFTYDVTVIDPGSASTGPATTDIVNYLLGLGPDLGNFDVNGDTVIDAADVVANVNSP